MNNEEAGNSLQSADIPSTDTESKLDAKKLPEDGPEDSNTAAPIDIETPQALEATEQSVDADRSPSLPEDHEPRTDVAASSVAVKSASVKKPQSFFEERPLPIFELAPEFSVIGPGATFCYLVVARWRR